MQVHPKECQSTSPVIPMTENRLLEPSFADAIVAIEQAKDDFSLSLPVAELNVPRGGSVWAFALMDQ